MWDRTNTLRTIRHEHDGQCTGSSLVKCTGPPQSKQVYPTACADCSGTFARLIGRGVTSCCGSGTLVSRYKCSAFILSACLVFLYVYSNHGIGFPRLLTSTMRVTKFMYINENMVQRMFGFGVWYTVCRDHTLSTFVKSLTHVFKTGMFHPHITVISCLQRSDADAEFLRTIGRVKPWFRLVGGPYQTKTNDVYAIQYRCAFNGIDSLVDFHMALAYRLHEPFTQQDLEHVKSMIPTSVIFAQDLYISLNDCRPKLPIHWTQIKREP